MLDPVKRISEQQIYCCRHGFYQVWFAKSYCFKCPAFRVRYIKLTSVRPWETWWLQNYIQWQKFVGEKIDDSANSPESKTIVYYSECQEYNIFLKVYNMFGNCFDIWQWVKCFNRPQSSASQSIPENSITQMSPVNRNPHSLVTVCKQLVLLWSWLWLDTWYE